SKYASLEDVAAIGVVGQAPTAALVNDDGAAIGNAILWLDTRASEEARELGTHAYYLGPKLLWLSRHGASMHPPDSARGRADAAWNTPDPNLLNRARWILQSHAFVAYRLTGVAAIDPSTAALCVPLFDFERRDWNPAACASCGVRADQLPPV